MLVRRLLLVTAQRGLVVFLFIAKPAGNHLRVHVNSTYATLRGAVLLSHLLVIVYIAMIEVLHVSRQLLLILLLSAMRDSLCPLATR